MRFGVWGVGFAVRGSGFGVWSVSLNTGITPCAPAVARNVMREVCFDDDARTVASRLFPSNVTRTGPVKVTRSRGHAVCAASARSTSHASPTNTR